MGTVTSVCGLLQPSTELQYVRSMGNGYPHLYYKITSKSVARFFFIFT